MKHREKANQILDNYFWQRTHILSNSKQADIHRTIDQLIDDGKSNQEVKEVAEGLLSMFFENMANELVSIKNKQVRDGIEWIGNRGNWINLKFIAEHALETAIIAAESDEKGSLGASAAKHYKMDLKFLNTGLSDYKNFIDEMKKMMLDEGVMHWLKALQNKPESEHIASWKENAKKLIIDLLDMDDEVVLHFDGCGDILIICKNDGFYAEIGPVKHWTVSYGMSEEYDGELGHTIIGSEFFHMERKERAVECLINRYLLEPTMIHIGSGSQSLEDIKNSGENQHG